MEFKIEVKLAIYRHFAEVGRAPDPEVVAERVGAKVDAVRTAYRKLQQQRVLLLHEDDSSIRMAPPFSGVPTQHLVESGGVNYFANCAWDSLGIPVALHKTAVIRSRCEQSLEPLVMDVGLNGPGPTDWVYHCQVPAAQWWDDLVYT